MNRRSYISGILIVTIGLFAVGIGYGQEADTFDLLIRNGRVYDGSLNPAFRADVAVKDGRIVQVARSIRGAAARTIDARGLVITPGFIDLHTHVDRGMYFPETMPCLNYLRQGVTTVVVGQCGSSAWNLFEQAEDQMMRWSEEGIGPNAALLVGHGTVRQLVMGREDRPPTPEELEEMKALVKEAMLQGAYGLSTGLIYVPGSFADTDEIVELVRVIAPYGGIYHSHIRNEAEELLESVSEAIEIGERAGVPVHISHFKVVGKENWGQSQQACALIEEARARGQKVTADQYPYRFSNGYPYQNFIPGGIWRGRTETEPETETERISRADIEQVFDYLRDAELIELYAKVTPYYPISEHHQQFLNELPRKSLVSLVAQIVVDFSAFAGVENLRERMLFIERLNSPGERERIREGVGRNIERVGAEKFIVGVCVERDYEGKSLQEIAEMRGESVEDTAIELELMGAKAVPLRMGEDDIEYIMARDYVGTGSDGLAPAYGLGLTHIRSYSTFLHKIKKYALEREAVSVEHVIRSQTSLPALIMNWEDRGWIKEGYMADIAVIDMRHIETPTSISNPHQYCRGVEFLVINGELVIDEGTFTGERPGRVLKLRK